MKQAEKTVSAARATDKQNTVVAALDRMGTRRFLTRRARTAARALDMPLASFVETVILSAVTEVEDTGRFRAVIAHRSPRPS
jgi:hypothetical protein